MAKKEQTFTNDLQPSSKKEWVLNRKVHFYVQVNNCTQTGSVQYITNLPFTVEEIEDLLKQVE